MKGICSWCRESPGVYPCPDSQCPDETALCVECEAILLFCPDHEVWPQYEWDYDLNADINRMMAQAMLDMSESEFVCPKCGGDLKVDTDFGFTEPIGLWNEHTVMCRDCEHIVTGRVEWEPLTMKFHKEQLRRWKLLIGELAGQLRVIVSDTEDGPRFVMLNPEWEVYLGDNLGRDLRIVVQAAKEILSDHTIREEISE